jgi:penicillin-binding protein 2
MTELTQDKNKPLYRRVILVTAFIVVAFFAITLRILFMQIIEGEKYRTLAQNNRIRLVRITSPRGIIYDRNRQILSATRPSYQATIILEDTEDLDKEIDFLSKILTISTSKLHEKIQSAPRWGPYKEIILKKDLTFNELATLEEYKLNIPGVNVEVGTVRSYPDAELAAHVMGYVGEISERQLHQEMYSDVHAGDQIGQFGLERVCNRFLIGRDGGKQIEVDAWGREMQVLGYETPRAGDNLVLTIDLELQRRVEELLGEKSGAIVVMDTRNGEILAMASHPSFNPNSFAAGIGQKEWSDLVHNPKYPLQNRAIQSHYPPGSIFKIIVSIAGLETGALTEPTTFYCSGSVSIGRWIWKCWKKGGHGRQNLHQAIVHSCNCYFYQAGAKIGAEAIAHYAQLFGLGQPTGVLLENEESGFIPTPAWKRKALKTKWYPGDTLSMAIGQGYISITPLQAVNFVTAVANGGTLYCPKLVRAVLNSQGEVIQNVPSQVIRKLNISQKNLEVVQRAMFGVVNEYGTAARAMIPDIKVAGKTGTAQMVSLRDNNKGGDLPEELKDHAWFCGYAPYESPEIAMVVFVEHGGKGGAACAPIAKEVFLKYFQLKQERSAPHPAPAPAPAPATGAPCTTGAPVQGKGQEVVGHERSKG